MKIVVYQIILGDGTLANMNERRLEGIYFNSSISEQLERIRTTYGKEKEMISLNVTNIILVYEKFRFIFTDVT